MEAEFDKIPDDLSIPENVEKARVTLSRHVEFLQARLKDEGDELQRQILQARIDNLVLAQKQLQAELTVPGHG